MTQFIGSMAHLIKHNKNSNGAQRPFVYSDRIDINVPSLVILGGALTTDESRAMGYISHMLRNIKNVSDVNIYAAVYEFGTVDPMLVKANVFRRAGRKMALDMDATIARRKEQELNEINTTEPTPGYIEDLYEIIFEPRIIRDNPTATAKNMGNMVLYSHCHGAIVVNMLADMATRQMQSAGFDKATINQCMANVIVIQHNPTAPLENAKFTTLNFMSASDDTLNFFDAFSKNVLWRDDIAPAYMGSDYANVFIAGKLNRTNGSEHGFSVGYRDNGADLTPNGKVIFGAEQNALNNAVNNMLSGIKTIDVEQLVAGHGIDVAQMRANGKELLSKFSR